MLTTVSITNVVDPGIRKHFVDEYKAKKVDLGLIFNVSNQESETDQYENYTGLGQFSQVSQGGTYSEDAPLDAYGVSLTPSKFGKMMKVTREMRKFAKTAKIWDGAKHLARAAARTEQTKGSSVLNNGFSGSYLSMTDNKALFASDHPRADGGTAQSNTATGAFGDSNLETYILAMEGQLDDRGQIIEVMPNKIVIPPALRKSVLQVLKSEGLSGSADNDINVYNGLTEYYGGTMKIVIWDYLGAAAGGSDTAWFLFDDAVQGLMWQWVEQAKVERDNSIGFKQDVVYYKGSSWFSYGWRDWRGSYGSTGVA